MLKGSLPWDFDNGRDHLVARRKVDQMERAKEAWKIQELVNIQFLDPCRNFIDFYRAERDSPPPSELQHSKDLLVTSLFPFMNAPESFILS